MRPLLLVALLLTGLSPGLARAQTGPATFTVLILGQTEVPEGIPLTIYPDDPALPVVETTTDGTRLVVVPDLPAGRYTALPSTDTDVLAGFVLPSTVGPGSSSQGLLVLERADPAKGYVRGQLRLPDGQPARLQFATVGSAPPGGSPASTRFISDGEGRFSFQLPTGEQTASLWVLDPFDAQGAIYERVVADLVVAVGQPVTLDVTLVLRPFGAVEGLVTNAATDAPVAGVTVLARATDNSFGASAVAGPDGRYTLDLPAGTYVIDAQPSSTSGLLPQYFDRALFASGATPVLVTGNATTPGIDFPLEAVVADFALTITGTVADRTGAPIAGATVAVYDRRDGFLIPNAAPLFAATSSADGSFEAASTDPSLVGRDVVVYTSAADYVAEFWDDRPSALVATVLTAPNAPTTFDLGAIELLAVGEQPEGFRVTGTIRDRDTQVGVPGAVAIATRTDVPGTYYAATAADGSYTLAGLPAGRYVVLFSAVDYEPAFFPAATSWTAAEELVVNEDRPSIHGLIGGLNRPVGTLRADGPGASLTGTVRDASGAALPGALVVARGGESGGGLAFAFADATGGYRLDGLPSESIVSVQTDLPRYTVGQSVLNLGPGAGLLEVQLSVLPLVSVTDGPSHGTSPLGLMVAPNPTRDGARVQVVLPTAGNARVVLYDLFGRAVSTLFDGSLEAGTHELRADVSRLAAGVYVLRVQSGESTANRRITVVR